MARARSAFEDRVYERVVSNEACPIRSATTTMSTPLRSNWVPNVCRRVRVDPRLAGVRVAGLVHQAGVDTEFGDHVAKGAHPHPFAAPRQEQRGGVFGAAVLGAFVQPGAQRGAGGAVQRHLAVHAALAVPDDHLPPAGGDHDVVQVEGFDFLDAQAGVEQQLPDRGPGARGRGAAAAARWPAPSAVATSAAPPAPGPRTPAWPTSHLPPEHEDPQLRSLSSHIRPIFGGCYGDPKQHR
jgi:hypothetical protein